MNQTTPSGRARPTSWLVLMVLGAVLLSGGCKTLDVPDLDSPSIASLTNNPTPSAVADAAQGILFEHRNLLSTFIPIAGEFGREGYALDPSNPQNPRTFFVVLNQDVGSGIWSTAYRNVKEADLVLSAVGSVAGLTAQEAEATRGFALTFKALDLLDVIAALDSSGAALDVTTNPTDPLPPIALKGPVYAQILQLFDQGATHLQGAGAGGDFPFAFPPGFTGFTTPAAFLKVNRGLKARADVYAGNYAAALTDIAASFIDTSSAAAITVGVYHNFGTASGDAPNPLYDPTTHIRFAHPSIWAGAQLQPGGQRDLRALAKVAPIPQLIRDGYAVSEKLTVYNSPTAPIAIIRDEELILLRAQANLALGNVGLATADINFIRVNSGGLAPIANPYVPTANQPTLLDELLYEKAYSLFWELGTRWIDARQYGKLAGLPHSNPGDLVFPYISIPINECDQRSPAPAGCAVPAGL